MLVEGNTAANRSTLRHTLIQWPGEKPSIVEFMMRVRDGEPVAADICTYLHREYSPPSHPVDLPDGRKDSALFRASSRHRSQPRRMILWGLLDLLVVATEIDRPLSAPLKKVRQASKTRNIG